MSLWQRYKSISPNTRLILGLGTIAYCTFALYVADGAEKALGFEAGEEDKRRLREAMPRIRVVERGEGRRGEDGSEGT